MYKTWSAVGATFFVVALLLVAPAGATDTWDLTQGPIVVSYTLDLSDAPNVPATATTWPNWWDTADWSKAGVVGLFSGTAGAQMVGFLSDTQPSANATNLYPTYPDDDAVLDMDDKFNMQEPAAGRWSESSYDIANCATKVVGSVVGSGNNYGVWFDRDGVDIYQAAMWGSVNTGTYNTGGIYEVVLTFDRAANDPGKGFVCATVNGIPTGFYAPPGWDNAQPDFYPAGISFAATPEQMRTMALVTTEGDEGIAISDVNVSGVATYTTAADCDAGESFVPSTGGTVSLPAVAGHNYLVEARGTYFAGGTSQFDIRADAQYSQDAIQRAADPSAAWTDSVNGYGTYGDILLDLTIDGQNVQWGAYDPNHEYSLTKVAGAAVLSFAFDINDIYALNNTGGLCVALTDLGNVASLNGLFAPISDANNAAKAGQVVPLKWRVLDFNGTPVSDLTIDDVGLTMTADACEAVSFDPVEVYAGTSGLQYNGDGYWQYNWKTAKAWAGGCGTLTLTVASLTVDTAYFLFK